MKNIIKGFTVYEYDELDEKAKEKALEWFAEGAFDYDWFNSIYMDAETVGLKINSFDLYRNEIDGEFILNVEDVFDGIEENHGEKCDTYKTAMSYKKQLQDLEKKHEKDEYEYDFVDAKKELEKEFLHDILEDYLSILKNEADWMQSREYLEETIRINEYEFMRDGSPS